MVDAHDVRFYNRYRKLFSSDVVQGHRIWIIYHITTPYVSSILIQEIYTLVSCGCNILSTLLLNFTL